MKYDDDDDDDACMHAKSNTHIFIRSEAECVVIMAFSS